jgi:hypothetical protein
MEHDPSGPIRLAVRADGSIVVPAHAVRALGLASGTRVSVRVTEERLSRRVQSLGVTDEEVDTIAAQQFEARENVLRFLAAEGMLGKRSGFRTRARVWRGR